MLTFLYAPADRPALVAKALAGTADVVIVDLEDAVAADGKSQARAELVRLLASPQPRVQIRVNDVRTVCGQADLRAVGPLCSGTAGIRVPKVESADDVRDVARAVPGVALHPLLESALGLERAYEIASADPAVASIGLGEADLRADLGVSDEAGLAWARSRVVVAARAAGLPAPVQSVYTDFRDLEGLAESCRVGRSMGFRGRAAIHPAQLPVIEAAYRPTEEEITAANEVVAAAGVGAVALPDGRFVDEAVVRQARSVLADALRTPATTPTPTGRCPSP
ncbi:citrate lyase subunit beta / citryl-CoA lyase [Streptosporangium subroseum]|uniref:Citrate lyase subunit beta / citryl-CoA lyase n=1 Tax=Streptosporangium subroseum TaxID=106412 RepID=A0A239CSM5_9ACTN|nr:CoA ester lyase [Streptosporangium subroseum]SNS23165.1 citrate lyase subunit beta / citryl-CoA lyase [Streptosporangium subroseum]